MSVNLKCNVFKFAHRISQKQKEATNDFLLCFGFPVLMTGLCECRLPSHTLMIHRALRLHDTKCKI